MTFSPLLSLKVYLVGSCRSLSSHCLPRHSSHHSHLSQQSFDLARIRRLYNLITVEVCKTRVPAFPCGLPMRKWQPLQASGDRLGFIYDYYCYCYTKGSRSFSQRRLHLWHDDRTNSQMSQKPFDHRRRRSSELKLSFG